MRQGIQRQLLGLLLWSMAAGMLAADKTVSITPDEDVVLKNPMQGWVIYAGLGDGLADTFWQTYDNFDSSEGKVRVSDYATTLYIRAAWSLFNPSEGVYVWDDSQRQTTAGRRFWMLMDGARARGLKVAFTFIVDSRDKTFDFTPAFVREAGARGYTTATGSREVWSPYPDDPVFQQKYANFLRAFAARYDDPDVTMFVSGLGLGKWGETHTLIYSTGDETPREAVFSWITGLMSQLFVRVPIVINYHRNLLMTTSNTSPELREQSRQLIDRAVDCGFSLRHDAFGMGDYYRQWELDYAASQRFRRPILMEGGWVRTSHGSSAYSDPHGYSSYADVRQGEYSDGEASHVNMMDLRYNSNITAGETYSWFNEAFSLVKSFIRQGGYRLYPDRLTVPTEVVSGATVKVRHRWQNIGWGYCPTNIPQWNQKYKVAVALLGTDDQPVRVFVDEQTDLSKWLKGTPVEYVTEVVLSGVPSGSYRWAVGLVDTTKGEPVIGLQMSVRQDATVGGWLPVATVDVKDSAASGVDVVQSAASQLGLVYRLDGVAADASRLGGIYVRQGRKYLAK